MQVKGPGQHWARKCRSREAELPHEGGCEVPEEVRARQEHHQTTFWPPAYQAVLCGPCLEGARCRPPWTDAGYVRCSRRNPLWSTGAAVAGADDGGRWPVRACPQETADGETARRPTNRMGAAKSVRTSLEYSISRDGLIERTTPRMVPRVYVYILPPVC